MAFILKADGTEAPIADCELETLQAAVGGYIEIITLPDRRLMVLDEEGKFKDYPVNELATVLAYGAGIAHDDYIVGDVVIAERGEID